MHCYRGLEKTKKLLSLLLLLLFCLFCQLLPATCSAYDTAAGQIVLSASQYSELVSLTNKQENLLTELQQQLALLTGTSTEQQELLTRLQTQLQQSKDELAVARQDLNTAKSSLANAKTIIAEQNLSLQQLSQQIKAERKAARLQQLRTGLWSILASVVADRIYLHYK